MTSRLMVLLLVVALAPSAIQAVVRPGIPRAGLQDTPLATFDFGRYRHTWSGIEFTVPLGWDVGTTHPSSDNGQQVLLTHRESGITMSVWMIKEKTPGNRVQARLDGAPAEKVWQRHNGYDIPGFRHATYDIPSHTVHRTWIGGRPAVVAVGEYLGMSTPTVVALPVTIYSPAGARRQDPSRRLQQSPERMIEYMTWIYSEDSRAFFFARVPAAALDTHRRLFDEIIQSAVVP